MAINKTIISGLTPAYDFQKGYEWLTIPSASGNVVMTASNFATGGGIQGSFYQDGSGSRTFTINGVTIPVNPAADSVTWWGFSFDGTTYFSTSNFAAGSSGTAAITPSAPTGGTVDDVGDTFTFTLNPLYTAAEHEYSINSGAWTDCTANVISVGNISVPTGALLVRVKAGTGRNASATLASAQAFTVLAGLVDANFNTVNNIAKTSSYWAGVTTNNAYGNTGLTSLAAPTNGDFEIRFYYGGAINNGVFFGVTSTGTPGWNALSVGVNIDGTGTLYYIGGGSTTSAGAAQSGYWYRITRTVTGGVATYYLEKSTDAVSWTNVPSFGVGVNSLLTMRASCDIAGNNALYRLESPKISGFQ
jgi:hypothetical protein